MKLNYTKMRQNIPHVVKLNKKGIYEVLYVDEFIIPSTTEPSDSLGETRFEPKQIILKNGQSDKGHVLTFLHEVLHAISEESDIKLTEKQVIGLEKKLPLLIELILKMDGRKNGK